jgi:hypothetical protein
MPLYDSNFEHDWASIKAAGYIERIDVENWLETMREYAAQHRLSVCAIMEDADIEFISNGARILLAESTAMPFIRTLMFVTRDPLLSQTIRMIAMLGERGRVLVFDSTDVAREFAALA